MKKENSTMITLKRSNRLLLLVFLLAILLSGNQKAFSVPSYARQTGLSCSACHNMFPLLNQFGREFKLNGYTMTGIKTIESTDSSKRGVTNMLKILYMSPLSAMLQTSFTHVSKKMDGTQNDNTELPQQFSFFYSGEITPHLGSFIQFTYSGQDGSLGLDNTELRFANHANLCKKDLIYGFTLNNNPSVQDVWNTIPAWRFPYASSDIAPSPTAAVMTDGALAQQVVGIGGYTFWNHLLYTEFSVYRSAQLGIPEPPSDSSKLTIKGVAPYWRVALQHQFSDNYLEIGTSGMSTRMYPQGVNGNTDHFTDIGIDMQYEYQFPRSSFIFHPLWTHETQNLDATFEKGGSENKKLNLNSLKIDAEMYFNKGYACTLGYFSVSGDKDSKIYGSTFNNNKPNSNGFIAQLDYMPWYNTKFSLQYVMYNKFDGAKNSENLTRKPKDNNTLYAIVWVCF